MQPIPSLAVKLAYLALLYAVNGHPEKAETLRRVTRSLFKK
jgi:hypothetical protein